MVDSTETVCVRCRVTGRVQGVFFRASTVDRARGLGLSGYARNLADGSVEIHACGRTDAVEALRAWLWEGPRHARVDAVVCVPAEPGEHSGFGVR
ncbi:MAG: acylphosphatase [Pseudomonadota bacterium]|nr:acylphosphatase [Pseudomonadota bacterium]